MTRFVTSVVRQAYEQGASNVDAPLLERTAELMVLRRDDLVAIDAGPAPSAFSVSEVG